MLASLSTGRQQDVQQAACIMQAEDVLSNKLAMTVVQLQQFLQAMFDYGVHNLTHTMQHYRTYMA
jgi:hypothetical protein